MPEVTNEVVANETAAPKAKKVKKVVKKTKPAAKPAKADKAVTKVKKPAKAKAERGPRITQEDKNNLVLEFLAKQKHPVNKVQILAGTGLKDGTNTACQMLGDKVKREAAKFHDMGRGYVFTITAKGRTAAAKL